MYAKFRALFGLVIQPKPSMYGIFIRTYHKCMANVGQYTYHTWMLWVLTPDGDRQFRPVVLVNGGHRRESSWRMEETPRRLIGRKGSFVWSEESELVWVFS